MAGPEPQGPDPWTVHSAAGAGLDWRVLGIAGTDVSCELLEWCVRQLRAGADTNFGEDVAQVEVDSARANEELGRHVTVGQALGDEPGDLQLLRSQLRERVRVALTRTLTRGTQLL